MGAGFSERWTENPEYRRQKSGEPASRGCPCITMAAEVRGQDAHSEIAMPS